MLELCKKNESRHRLFIILTGFYAGIVMVVAVSGLLIFGIATDSFVGDARSDLLEAFFPICGIVFIYSLLALPVAHGSWAVDSVIYDAGSQELMLGKCRVLVGEHVFSPEYIFFGVGVVFFWSKSQRKVYSFISSYSYLLLFLPVRLSFNYKKQITNRNNK